MNEQDVRKIVKEEFWKNYNSGTPNTPPHKHDDVSGTRIEESDLIKSVGVMGKIDFAHNATYTLYFSTLNPSRLDLNAMAFDNGSLNSSALIVGVALLSKTYYFQPLSTRAAKQGGLPYPIGGVLAQCSSNLFVLDASNPSATYPHVDQFFIMNAFYSTGPSTNAHIVTGQLQNLTPNSIDIVITNLLSGWKVSANFIIT